ncbi:MAG: AAA family ATPase [Myxococcota bacterium]|nr:AAA family ATPase [Myxococcota bacterium]
MSSAALESLKPEVDAFSEKLAEVQREVGRVVVGQQYMVERLLLALIADGHILLEGLPGLAKTTAVKTLAGVVQTAFSRISFTPDLLPADVIGTEIYRPNTGEFSVKKGPIFTNLLLADEINRAPAKVQSALLEAMQERQVTLGDQTYQLDRPFLVLATQNPVEQEGTYPLPEAQVDRFMLKLKIGYPSREEEREIMRRAATPLQEPLATILTPEDILNARQLADQIYMDPKVENYIVDLVFATREPGLHKLQEIEPFIEVGASPRATINLNRAARVQALMSGRAYVTPQDIKTIAPDILRHRLILTYEAEARGFDQDDIVTKILSTVDVP